MRSVLAFLSLPMAEQLDPNVRPRTVSATTTTSWSPLANPVPSMKGMLLPLHTTPTLPRLTITQAPSLPILEDESTFAFLTSYLKSIDSNTENKTLEARGSYRSRADQNQERVQPLLGPQLQKQKVLLPLNVRFHSYRGGQCSHYRRA